MAEDIKLTQDEAPESRNFIHAFIEEDIGPGGQFEGMTVHTRFPPEPNGYLHIGHCKALIIDFGTAEKFGGLCNLRMDDTNPAKEDTEYVDAIQEDIHWLGFDWGDRFYYGSDYFEKTYELAVGLIKKGLAYVCELTPEQFREYRGDTNTPARSPWRDRPIEESLDLFQRMKNGEFPEGKYTLRAKIDLASGNFNMRDPVLYRIRYIEHHRQGTKWCIFPMYDFAHPIQDALEGITHSLCSLEYEDHRPLYNWVIEHTDVPSKPRQIEFARLGIDHTVLSKRKLRKLVEEHYVSGWDDPRMPTLCGLRRRGYTPRSIRNFCERIGVAKTPSTVDYGFLEHCLREDLNETAQRTMAVHPAREADHHQLPGGAERDRHRGEQPPGPRRRHPGDHLLPPPLYRVRRLPGDPGAQVQAPVPQRPGVPPEGRVPDPLHRLREGRGRQRHRGPGGVRPRQPGRRPRRRPEGEGCHHPLGGRRHRHRRGGAPVRQPVHRRRSGRGGQELPGVPEPRLPGGPHRLQGGALPGGRRSPRPASSSCAWATSAWTARTPSPATWCSTAP